MLKKLVISLLLVLLTKTSYSQINVQNFHSSDESGTFTLFDPEEREDFLRFKFLLDYVENPLPVVDENQSEQRQLIKKIYSLSSTASTKIGASSEVGFNLPVHLISTAEIDDKLLLGDMRLFGQFDVFKNTHLRLLTELFIPFGNSDFFLSSDQLGYGGGLAYKKKWSVLSLILNAGIRYFPSSEFENLDYNWMLPAGLAMKYPINSNWSLWFEAKKNYLLKGIETNSPGYFLLGLEWASKEQNGTSAIYGAGGLRNYSFNQTKNFEGVVSYYRSFKKEVSMPKPPLTLKPEPRWKMCQNKKTLRQKIRKLTLEEVRNLSKSLPYRSSPKNKIEVLNLEEATRFYGENATVKNSQILFAVENPIFQNSSSLKVVSNESIILKLNLTKVSSEKSISTEVFCNLNLGLCSGELFSEKSWQKNIDQGFFSTASLVNNFFSKQYLTKEVGRVGKKKIFSSGITLDLNKLFSSEQVSEKELFEKMKKERTLFFVIADDTYVDKEGYLEIEVNEEYRCLEEMGESKKDTFLESSGKDDQPLNSKDRQ